MSHYDILGLNRKAKLADIKRAYRRLARKHHPDLNPGDRRSEELFKKINEAYEVLGDAQKRKAYDRETGAGPAGAGGRHPDFAGEPRDFGAPFDFGTSDDFSSFISEILRAGGQEAHAPTGPRRGEDVTRTLSLDFFQALHGLSTTLEIDSESICTRCSGAGRVPSADRKTCPECGGSGRISISPGPLRLTTPCRRCGGEGTIGWDGCGNCAGTGVLTRRESIRVAIPAGVDQGSRVRVAGKGRIGRNGGPPGDLYVVTQVATHPFFRRIGDNIHCAVPITVSEAALGTRIEVPTIDGRARIRIPPGTETGQQFRLRGKGAPSLRGTGRGDQYIETRITTPRVQSDRARQLLQELGTVDAGDDLRRGLFG